MISRFPRTHAHDLPCERCAFIRSLHSPRSPHGPHGPHGVCTGACTGISKNLEGVGGAKGKDEMDEGDEDADVKLRMRLSAHPGAL